MLVFPKERLAILAVPKTGTTALEAALAPRAGLVLRDPPILKHAPLYRYRRFIEPLLRAAGGELPETLAVVRHPVDWLGSWWRYRARADVAGTPVSTQGLRFDDFVAEWLRDDPGPVARIGAQARFVGPGDGRVQVTHLFRYEEAPRLHAFLEERLKVRLDLARLNVSPQMPLALSPGMEARLRAERPAEFAVWEAAGAS